MDIPELKNKSLAHIRGFNYHPSFASHGITRWLDRHDADTVKAELERGKERFPWMNTVRIWLSLDAWWDNRALFLENLDTEVEICRALGLKMMPMLFNGIANIPDYGSLTPTDADRITKPDGGHNLRVLYLDYVKDIAERHAADEVVVVWDLCNEPGLHYRKVDDPIRQAFFFLLEKTAEELRRLGAVAPIGVGNYGPVQDDECVLGFVDCLLTHRYHVPHCMTEEEFTANVAETAVFANRHDLPWCVSECTWGAWEDEKRAKLLPGLEKFLKIGAGVVPYVLYESPAMDAHGRDFGISYGWGAPEDLCFIRRDGSLRKGHGAINELMAKYPLANDTPPADAASVIGNICFRPGGVWLDTDGRPIQAHGGGILNVRDTWYWYGQNMDGPTTKNAKGTSRVDVIGVSCYSSKDLYNWKNEGLALAAVKDRPNHDLAPGNVLERPKVVYNETTGKYVMWFHLDSENYAWAEAGVAIADTPTGPFRYLGKTRPSGQELRDMTLFRDDDGRAYLIYTSENNETLHISLLSDDYTEPVGEPHRILIHMVREAPVIFKQDGLYYLVTSACTGWKANRAWLSTAEDIMGKWLTLRGGECLVGDPVQTGTTFHSQGTFALTVQRPGKENQVVFMADRWNPDDLGDSRYVWLPVKVDGRLACVAWRNEWRLA